MQSVAGNCVHVHSLLVHPVTCLAFCVVKNVLTSPRSIFECTGKTYGFFGGN